MSQFTGYPSRIDDPQAWLRKCIARLKVRINEDFETLRVMEAELKNADSNRVPDLQAERSPAA